MISHPCSIQTPVVVIVTVVLPPTIVRVIVAIVAAVTDIALRGTVAAVIVTARARITAAVWGRRNDATAQGEKSRTEKHDGANGEGSFHGRMVRSGIFGRDGQGDGKASFIHAMRDGFSYRQSDAGGGGKFK